jgi:hypothetical protein
VPFVHCPDCGDAALVDPSGRCPEGHTVAIAAPSGDLLDQLHAVLAEPPTVEARPAEHTGTTFVGTPTAASSTEEATHLDELVSLTAAMRSLDDRSREAGAASSLEAQRREDLDDTTELIGRGPQPPRIDPPDAAIDTAIFEPVAVATTTTPTVSTGIDASSFTAKGHRVVSHPRRRGTRTPARARFRR